MLPVTRPRTNKSRVITAFNNIFISEDNLDLLVLGKQLVQLHVETGPPSEADGGGRISWDGSYHYCDVGHHFHPCLPREHDV